MTVLVDGYEIRLTLAQRTMILNSAIAFRETVPELIERELILGGNAEEIVEIMESAQPADHGSRYVLRCSLAELHSIYSLLVNLPGLFVSEEVFHNRVGAYRENLVNLAAGLRVALRPTT